MSRHRRPAFLLTTAGVTVAIAAVAAAATVVSAMADASGEVREWVEPEPSASVAPEPFRVSVQGAGSGDAVCMRGEWVVRGGLKGLRGDPAPPSAQFGPSELPAWFAAHGAETTADDIVFIVENLRPGKAVLRDLRAVVEKWEAAPDAARVVVADGGCGGNLEIQQFDVTLRDTPAPITLTPRHATKGFPYTVAEDDPMEFEVGVVPPAGVVTWHLELRWVYGGKIQTTRLPTVRSGAGRKYCAESLLELTGSPGRCA